MDLVGLADAAEQRVGTYSLGMRQRLGVAQALVGEPGALILDEPANGLDPEGIAWMLTLLRDFADRGGTVLLSSHILAEVEALCDRVSIVRAGRTVESGSLAELRHLTRTSVSAETARPPDGLRGVQGVHGLEVNGCRVRCAVDAAQLGSFLERLGAYGILTLVSRPPTLEELFLRHYGDHLEIDGSDAAAPTTDHVGRHQKVAVR